MLHSKTWMAGTSPAMTGKLVEINQPDPVGDQSRLSLAVDLDGDVGAGLQLLRLAQLGFDKREAAADARAGAHWRQEAQLVETVVHPHRGAFDDRHHLIGHD